MLTPLPTFVPAAIKARARGAAKQKTGQKRRNNKKKKNTNNSISPAKTGTVSVSSSDGLHVMCTETPPTEPSSSGKSRKRKGGRKEGSRGKRKSGGLCVVISPGVCVCVCVCMCE